MSLWDWLLNPAGLTAHGFCLSWAPGLVALHAGSDAVVGLAYLSIPLALASFASQRKDLSYGWVLYLFVAFIMACGTTHLMSIMTLWVPAYGVEGVIKLVTAVLSIATAGILWPLIPKLAALPSPAQLEGVNQALRTTVAEQERTAALLRDSERQVRTANLELERRVAEQTAELRRANSQLTEALAERTAALEQRDILLREVYHRVKNNLQLVDSLVQMQARHLSDAAARTALAGLRRRVQALGLVHHQLMASSNLKTFDIGPFLRELSDNIVLGGAETGVRLAVEAAPLDVGLDFAIPLGLIVTELVSNALKHAFPDGNGNISVVLTLGGEGSIVLTVCDDGQGLAGGAVASGLPTGGMGAKIITALVNQLEGKMTVNGDHGMRIDIRFAAPVNP